MTLAITTIIIQYSLFNQNFDYAVLKTVCSSYTYTIMENKFLVYRVDKKRVFGFIAAVLLPIVFGILSGVLSDFSQYGKLTHPKGSPAPVMFTLVWSALYVFMGVASFLIWRDTEKYTPKKPDVSLIYYFIMLIVAFLWPILFFNLNMRLLAAVWLAILIAAAVVVTLKFLKINKTAGYLMIPLLVWLVYALYLNIGFIIVN